MNLLDSIKNSLTPITDRLRDQFGIGAPAPSDSKTPNFIIPADNSRPAPSPTPITDSLREKFSLGDIGVGTPADNSTIPYTPVVTPFVRNLFDTVTSSAKNVASAGKSFLDENSRNLTDFASGKLTLTPSDWISGLEQTGLGTINLTGKLAQGFDQGILRIGTSIADATLPGYKESRQPFSLTKDISGMDKVDTYQEIYKGANDWALSKQATPIGAKTFAGFAVLGSMFADEPGIGSGEKAAFTLSKDAVERLSKETTDEGVKLIIQQQNPNMTPGLADFVTPLFKGAETPEEVSQALKLIQGSEKTALKNMQKKTGVLDLTKDYVPPTELTPEAKTSFLDQFNTPEIQAAREATQNAEPTVNINTPERNDLRDLISKQTYGEGAVKKENRLDLVIGSPASGKSTLVEDLAKEHGSFVPDADVIKKQLPEYGVNGEGSQVVHAESTQIAAVARKMARDQGDNTVLQMVGHDAEQVKKNIKLYADAGYDVHLHYVELAPEKAAARAAERFKNGGHFIDPEYIMNTVGLKPSNTYDIVKGYEGVKSYTKYSNDVQRGSPLARIESSIKGSQAESTRHGLPADSGRSGAGKDTQGAKVSENLTKSLGKAKNPYEILNILKNEYPNLPDRVIDRLVTRFMRTKRIENVENLIRSARNLDNRFKPGGDVRLAEKPKVTLQEFIADYKKDKGYGMSHRPNEDGPRAFNLTEPTTDGEQMIPKDMYEQWYGSRGTAEDKESISALKAIKDNPEADVTVYRASPSKDLNNGDWVSFSKKYAEGEKQAGEKVSSFVVKAKDVRWAMDDINEFGYYPSNETLTGMWSKNLKGEEKIPPSTKEILDKTTSPTVRKVMRQDQKLAYIKTLKDKFVDPSEAVFAEQEYNKIWDDVSENVVKKYEETSLNHQLLQDALSYDDRAEAVFNRFYKGKNRSVSDSQAGLEDLMHSALKKREDRANYRRGRGTKKPGPLTATEEAALKMDQFVQDQGFADLDEAQKAVERYAEMKQEIKNIGQELKEMRPRVREAKILQEGLDEIAVIPREQVTAMDRLITPAHVRDYFKDIAGFSGKTRDVYRNFEKFFGDKYPEVKKAILDPFDRAKGRFVDTNKELATGLKEGVTEKFNIKRGSPESAAIMQYGDTGLDAGSRLSYKDLVEKFGKEKADNIVEADKWFREQYDTLIDDINSVRKKIYPNTPSKLVAKRKDYYRHFQDIGDTWSDALREFFSTPSGIDPKLVGISEFTNAKTRFLPFAEARTGKNTALDAVGGFVDYIPMFAYAKNIDPEIQNFRYLQRKIAESAPRAGETVMMADGKPFKSKGAENFLSFLQDFTRDLTGNTNPGDRELQKWIPGGRKTMRVANYMNNRMKANTIGANFGSALAQIANVPQGIADTKLYAIPGFQRSIASIFIKGGPIDKSIFMKERYMPSLHEEFPLAFKDHPVRASGDVARKQARWVMEKADEIGTRFIWNAEYEKFIGQGMSPEEAILASDGRTRKLVAGRGIGEVPLAQKALVTKYIAPFTTEVGNAWWVMKDWVDAKDVTALMTFFIANYMLNEASSHIRGSRITIDPIDALLQGSQSLWDEHKAGHDVRGALKLVGRLSGEAISNIPFGQTAAALLPDSAVQAGTKLATGAPMTKNEIFGDSSAGRFGTPLLVSGLQDAVFRLLPPVGGLQLKKTYQGIKALLAGHAEDSKGAPTFDVQATPQNVARALFFGANATSESQQYFKDRTDLFSRIDRQSAEAFVKSSNAEADWASMKKLTQAGKGADAADLLQKIATKDPLEAKAIVKIAADERKGLTPNDRLVSMLNVANGERASYIVQQLKKMKSGDEKAQYLEDLDRKKLLSALVVQQVSYLLAH